MGWYAFHSSGLTELKIPSSVENINNTFRGCKNLEWVIIPKKLVAIISQAFYLCENIKAIYYMGNELDWSGISIDESSSIIGSAKRYYYSPKQPVKDGNYWRYIDGVPAVWEE